MKIRWEILADLFLAMFFCLIIIAIMRWVAKPLVWLSILGVIASLGAGKLRNSCFLPKKSFYWCQFPLQEHIFHSNSLYTWRIVHQLMWMSTQISVCWLIRGCPSQTHGFTSELQPQFCWSSSFWWFLSFASESLSPLRWLKKAASTNIRNWLTFFPFSYDDNCCFQGREFDIFDCILPDIPMDLPNCSDCICRCGRTVFGINWKSCESSASNERRYILQMHWKRVTLSSKVLQFHIKYIYTVSKLWGKKINFDRFSKLVNVGAVQNIGSIEIKENRWNCLFSNDSGFL